MLIIKRIYILAFIFISTFAFFSNSDLYAGDLEEFIEKVKAKNDLSIIDREKPLFKSDLEENSSSQTIRQTSDFNYSKEKWIKTRKDIEEGVFEQKFQLDKSTQNIELQEPSAPPPQLEFTDSGTSMSVTGRKVINVNYSGKKYLHQQANSTRKQSTSLFDINQQMQVRMQGKVGDKINVNVDYDDTKTDKQDISVVYKGDPNETVQNISFGDIDLSLPATEFVSYNKQLFGIRADLQTGHFKFTFIGSRTKGQTKTKQFIGNTQFQSMDILDTNYIRRKYYDISFGNVNRLPIKSGSEKVYIDQQTNEAVDGITISSMTADDLGSPSSVYSGRFKLLNAGIDYVIDYNKGIIVFSRNLNPQDVVIIDYLDANNNRLSSNTGNYKIIKTINDIYLSSATQNQELGYRRELKTYYSIGQTNIIRDDGRGNFRLSVQDLNRRDIGSTLNPPQLYPDTIEVDFEQGIFNLQKEFALETDPNTPDPQIYSPSPISKRIIHLEYYYRLKTFTLEPNIVLNSEVITIDGKKINKNEDYYIDYDSGFITFYYPDKIGSNSVINITYEVAPFAGSNNQSLVGGRISYDLSKLSMGSTLLYQGNIKSNTSPNIQELSSSIMVYEFDSALKNLNILGLKTSLSGEIAQSRMNPNLNDNAIVENMENIKQEDAASMDHNQWVIASNPSNIPSYPDSIKWTSYEINSTEINPNSANDEKQRVLEINYDLSISSEVSIVYPMSTTGLDFSQKTAIELIVQGDSSNNKINLHFGQINEDSDGSGGQTLYCSGGKVVYNAPKTEDLNCDGQLSSSEDIGWIYDPQFYHDNGYSYNPVKFGSLNGRIDTQDLNGNGRLDAQDFTGGDFGYVNDSKFKVVTNTELGLTNSLNFTGWETLVYPMVISSSDSYKWSNIKQVRFTIQKVPGSNPKGIIKIARIAAVGNAWNVSSDGYKKLSVLAVNNIDNSDYIPIYNIGGDPSKVYGDLYGSVSKQKSDKNLKNISEQALEIDYSNLYSTDTAAYVYKRFTKAIDIGNHKKLNFLIYNPKISEYDSFYLKFGDTNNFYKAKGKLDFTGWRLYTIGQVDLNNDKVPDIWVNDSKYDLEISSVGTPSLRQISMIIAGVETSTQNASGYIYLNELFVSEPIVKTGDAHKLQADFEVSNFMSFGGKYRYVDRNFETPVSAITNQDNEQETGYLNLFKPAFFPTSYTYSKQTTKTPNTYLTGDNNLVNYLQEGKVEKMDATASGILSIWILPKFNLSYARNDTKYEMQAREDTKDTYSGNTNYNVPLNIFILPNNVIFNYSYTRSLAKYDENQLRTKVNYYNTDERTQFYSTKLAFTPFSGFNFNPGYSLSQTRETKKDLNDIDNILSYPKAMQQTVELNSNLKIFSWLNPSVNYSITTIENNNLNVTTVTVAQSSAAFNIGDIKTINRNSQGAVNLTLNMNEIMPKNKLLRSFIISSSYQLQDGDVWQNVERSYDSKSQIWIRKDLTPKSKFAVKNSQTWRDTYNSTQRWQPLEGFTFSNRLKALSTISITNNFNMSKQRSFTTGTISRTRNTTLPDLVFTMSQIEKLTYSEKWMNSGILNLKYSLNNNETISVSKDINKTYGADFRFKLLDFMDTSMSYNYKNAKKRDLQKDIIVQETKHNDASLQGTFDIKKYRFTPKIDYSNDYAIGALKNVTQNTTQITPSVLIKTDIQNPKGLKLPFFKDTMVFTNRIIWTNTISYTIKKSPITQADNNRLLSISSNADYEASKNLRISINGSIQRYWHKYLKEEEYISYQAGATATLQF